MAAVEDAVLVAGGMGSRMLPASAAIAKEALPLVDIPALSHLAREAVAAGAKRIHIITSPNKDLSQLLKDNSWLHDTRPDLSAELLSPFNDIEVLVHVQEVPKGFGDALSCALHAIDGPFMDLEDPQGNIAQAIQARDLGFSGKGSIHPKQVADLNTVFTPSKDQIQQAKKITKLFEEADTGLVMVDGKLIEKPVLREMYRILAISNEN